MFKTVWLSVRFFISYSELRIANLFQSFSDFPQQPLCTAEEKERESLKKDYIYTLVHCITFSLYTHESPINDLLTGTHVHNHCTSRGTHVPPSSTAFLSFSAACRLSACSFCNRSTYTITTECANSYTPHKLACSVHKCCDKNRSGGHCHNVYYNYVLVSQECTPGWVESV